MIQVSIYGKARTLTKLAVWNMPVDSTTVKQLIGALSNQCGVDQRQLMQCIVFVNGVSIDKLKMFRTQLNSGDKVALLSPVSGG